MIKIELPRYGALKCCHDKSFFYILQRYHLHILFISFAHWLGINPHSKVSTAEPSLSPFGLEKWQLIGIKLKLKKHVNIVGQPLNQLVCNRANSSGNGPAHLENIKTKDKQLILWASSSPTRLEWVKLIIWKSATSSEKQ